jgi:histidinol-phosphatase (PHP family)
MSVIVDYHMHLRRPAPGREEVDHTPAAVLPYVEKAAERGVDEIGFTEHVYYFRQTQGIWINEYESQRCAHDLDLYVDTILDAKRQGLPVKLGLEVDYVGDRQERLTEAIRDYPWDFLLGSVHYLGTLAIDQQPGIWADHTVEEAWRRYADALAELAASGSVDVFAHPDLPKIFGRRPDPHVLAEVHERIAEIAGDAGIALEISTAGLRKPVGELYPDPALLRACVERGVPVTTASDAHLPSDVGRDFDQALALAREAGCETVTVFEGRRGRQEPFG